METHIGARVKQFRELKNMRQNAFCELAGIRQQTLSTIEAGSSEPSAPVLQKLFLAYPDLNPEWLMLGTGAITKDGRLLTPTPKPGPQPDYTSAEGTGLAAVNILLKEQIADLRKQNQQLLDMLGKSPGSSDAAGRPRPSQPSAPLGFLLSVQRRTGQRGVKAGR